eukprot:GEMP01129366.1.p1 GENE.GEMP01129366.1~~GEMP01129366.1.p1  ORF type:complete len:118 (-),score=3.48 GEMP01129366.1:133-486(-)
MFQDFFRISEKKHWPPVFTTGNLRFAFPHIFRREGKPPRLLKTEASPPIHPKNLSLFENKNSRFYQREISLVEKVEVHRHISHLYICAWLRASFIGCTVIGGDLVEHKLVCRDVLLT